MKYKFFVILTLIVLTTGCKKIELSKDEYLIFGHFYGECIGENCIEYFRLEKNQILEDTSDKYNFQQNCGYNFVKLSDEDFDKVKNLLDFIPKDLLNQEDTVFGCPDCADGGGIYIEYFSNGVKKQWTFDKIKENVPEKYHDFLFKVEEYIEILN